MGLMFLDRSCLKSCSLKLDVPCCAMSGILCRQSNFKQAWSKYWLHMAQREPVLDQFNACPGQVDAGTGCPVPRERDPQWLGPSMLLAGLF